MPSSVETVLNNHLVQSLKVFSEHVQDVEVVQFQISIEVWWWRGLMGEKFAREGVLSYLYIQFTRACLLNGKKKPIYFVSVP